MQAAYITTTGGPEVIQFGELPDPTPAEGQALVRGQAVSVNPVDTYIRAGANYWPLPEKFIIGSDLAGVVEAVGPGVTEFKVGDLVWCTNQGLMGRQGTFAELSVVDAHWLYKRPENVTAEAAAACALVGVTAHLGLFRDAQLQAGETIVVQGGSGGVGSMVVQMAKAAGATVIATCGGTTKMDLCRELGADHAINYREADVAAEISKIAPAGVNVFWETQREPNFDFIVPTLAERGRIVLMAGRDARPEFPVGPFYVKECRLFGFVMFKATPAEMQVCGEAISGWLADGRLRPQIGKTFPLASAAAAHQLQEDNTLHKQGTLHGKIVLTI